MPSKGNIYLDNGYSVEAAIAQLSTTTTDSGDNNTAVNDYRPRKAVQAAVEHQAATPKKAGIQVTVYDPVLSALLAGEL